MYKGRLFFIIIFLLSNYSYALKFELSPFRFNRYVYYEILYKIQGISPAVFKDVKIIEDTSSKLVFEYDSKRYTAHSLAKGSIMVEMPEGLQNRYLSRISTPDLILSQYNK